MAVALLCDRLLLAEATTGTRSTDDDIRCPGLPASILSKPGRECWEEIVLQLFALPRNVHNIKGHLWDCMS
jgi:hypothetical protein